MDWSQASAQLEREHAERPVVIPGPQGALFGIFTSPAPNVPPAGKSVILFGRNRWQRDRMGVDTARLLAQRGFSCLRFDYHGYGESEGPNTVMRTKKPWRDQAVAVIRFLRETMGLDRFVVSGFCFDGLTALSAFQSEWHSIDGLVFIAAPVLADTLQPIQFRYVGRARNFSEKIQVFLKLPVAQKLRIVEQTMRRCSERTSAVVRPALLAIAKGEEELRLSPAFRKSFAALARSRARALFLYGIDDNEYREFQVAERTLFAKLDSETCARLEIEIWPGQLHVPQATGVQRQILTRTVNWIETLHPSYEFLSSQRLSASNL